MAGFLSLPDSLQEDILGLVAAKLDAPRLADLLLLSRKYVPYLRKWLYRSVTLRVGPQAYRAQKFARTLDEDPLLGTLVKNIDLIEAHLGALSYGTPGTQLAQNILRWTVPTRLRLEAYTIPIWTMTALNPDNLQEITFDFRCDRWLWRPPEDTHLLSDALDSDDGLPWFLKRPAPRLTQLAIVRPPTFPTSTLLVDLALRMAGPGLTSLTVDGMLGSLWHPTSKFRRDRFEKLKTLTIALGDIHVQIPPGMFPKLHTLHLTVVEETQVTELPRFIQDAEWLPSLSDLHVHFGELILQRFLEEEMREIHVACRDRGIRYYIEYANGYS